MNGSAVMLKAEAGQAVAMVIHELATNAAKYGALSTTKGRVSIRWDRRLNGRPRSDLVLEWQEIGGPPVSAPSNSGYGTSTIRDLIPYEFDGTVDHVFPTEGVQCRLKFPLPGLATLAILMILVQGSSLALPRSDRWGSHRATPKTQFPRPQDQEHANERDAHQPALVEPACEVQLVLAPQLSQAMLC